MDNLEQRVKKLEINITYLLDIQLGKEDEKEEVEKVNPLKPKMGDDYWYVETNFPINYNCDVWDNDMIDKVRLAMGNVFLSEQAVKDEIAKRKATQVIKTYIATYFPFVPDWENGKQEKHYIYYAYNCQKYYSHQTYSLQDQPQIGFLKSEEDCKVIIEKFKKELDIIFNNK